MKIFFRFTIILFCLVCTSSLFSQSTANYSFTNVSNASLTDMTGATQIINAGADDAASTVRTIPFDFYLMGVRYTQFSASSNGFVRLGGTAVTTTTYGLGNATAALIASFGSDEMTQVGTGGVFFTVTGEAPNRVLTIEFRNMTVIYDAAAATGDATSQVRLYETTGIVELVYGSVNRNSSTGFQGGMEPQFVGFTTGNIAGTIATVTTATHELSTTALTSNQYTLGAPVAELTSVAQGSRVMYSFTPAVPPNPTDLSFSAINAAGMTLNWVDVATNELSYLVYRSDDEGVNYNLVATLPANSTSSVQGGLTPSTNYFWKVVAVSEGAFSSGLIGPQATSAAGNIVSNGTGGGLWSEGATWVGGVPPSSGDNVIIAATDNVTLDVTSTILGLTVAGTLQYEVTTARTLNVGLNADIIAGGLVLTGASGSVIAHILAITGNLTNDGTLDLAIGTAGTVLNFNGGANSTFSGTGATTDLFSMTMSKSSRAQIVELNLTNFSVRNLSAAATGALLTTGVGTGTVKISGTNTFNGNIWSVAGYTIPATLGFWLNNPNFTVNGQNGSPTVTGLFRMTQGTYNIGTATGNSMGFSANSVIIVEGGAINATGRFGVAAAANIFSYTQTGGTITVCLIGNISTALGNFDLGTSTASSISISAGTIIVQNRSAAASGPRDYRVQSGGGIVGVTGGTVQLGNASTTAGVQAFNIAGVFPDLVITNTTGNHTATMLAAAVYNNVTRNITINTGNTINFGAVFLFAGTSIVNNGTITHTGGTSRFITFEPNTNVSYSGSGVVTAPMTSLELQNDLNFTIDPASPDIIAARVIIFSGSFVNSNKLILGNGGVTTATVQIGNTTTPTGGGNFDVAPTFNLGTGGQNLSALRTNIPINIGTAINSTRILNNLNIDPDVNKTVFLTNGDATVRATLSLTSGFLDLGGNTLTLGTSAAAPGTLTGSAVNIINGSFKRWINTVIGNIIFPIGTQIDAPDAAPGNNPLVSEDRFYSPSTEEYAGTVGYMVEEAVSGSKNKNSGIVSSADEKTKVNSVTTTDGAPINVTRTAAINYTVAPVTGGTLTATWISTAGGSNGLPLTEGAINVNTTSADGFWRFTAGDGLAGGTYNATFTATGILGVNDFTQLVLVKRADGSSPWTLDGTHVTTTGSNAAPILSRTDIISGFSDFAVGGDFAINPLPVELSSFTAIANRNDVSLRWTTVSESNNQGFDVERKSIGTETWSKVGHITGTGNSSISVNYNFVDRNVATAKYNYRLKQMDFNGNFEYHQLASLVEIGVPSKFDLSQNYPNPFNPTTKINYDLPFDSKVSIKLFDMSGREVANIVSATQPAGYHTIQFNGTNMASGIYFYNIIAEGGDSKFVTTKKMVLVK